MRIGILRIQAAGHMPSKHKIVYKCLAVLRIVWFYTCLLSLSVVVVSSVTTPSFRGAYLRKRAPGLS